jgi:hypothetical protein
MSWAKKKSCDAAHVFSKSSGGLRLRYLWRRIERKMLPSRGVLRSSQSLGLGQATVHNWRYLVLFLYFH